MAKKNKINISAEKQDNKIVDLLIKRYVKMAELIEQYETTDEKLRQGKYLALDIYNMSIDNTISIIDYNEINIEILQELIKNVSSYESETDFELLGILQYILEHIKQNMEDEDVYYIVED